MSHYIRLLPLRVRVVLTALEKFYSLRGVTLHFTPRFAVSSLQDS